MVDNKQPKNHPLGSTVPVQTAGKAQPTLLVLAEGLVISQPLPAQGELLIGRSPECPVRIDHASISRKHAILRVGESLSIEDLGSANGTFLAGKRLAPGEPQEISYGQSVDIGSTVLVLRANASMDTPIWSFDHFERRFEEELLRVSEAGEPLACLRLHLRDQESMQVVVARLRSKLTESEMLAAFAPGELLVLLVGRSDNDSRALADELRRAFGKDHSARIGLACHPSDGRSVHALIATASRGTRDESQVASGPVVDSALEKLSKTVKRIAAGNISVLVSGETGVGKESLARLVHDLSPRSDKPFLPLNCAAISESLIEGELFGHEKGAFTGANAAKPGLLESAPGGTVFLDEVGELPESTQTKLLRALEQKQVMRVGARAPRDIDVRFVSATNRDLEAEVRAGRFREDLLYRINGVTLRIPPLRERAQELERFTDTFVSEVVEELGLHAAPSISPESMQLMREYRWPGNIRQLRNVIERAVLLCEGDTILPEHLPEALRNTASPEQAHPLPGASAHDTAPQPLESEHQRILDALEDCAWNQTRAAELLGVSRRTLTTKLNKYNIARPRKGRKA